MTSRDSAYRRLADELARSIRAGDYHDRQLPTEHQLVEATGLSRGTVRRAMQELVNAGLVERSPGRGTFPTGSADGYLRRFGSVEDLLAFADDTDSEVLDPLRIRIDFDLARHLRLTQDSVGVVRIRRLFREVPFTVTTMAVPPDIAELLMDRPELQDVGRRSRTTVIGLLESEVGLSIREASQSIVAVACPSEAAADLVCEAAVPVLRIDRLYTDETGRVVEFARGYFDPSHYVYRTVLRRSDGF